MLHDNIRHVITYQIGMIQQGEDAINLSFLQRQRTVMSQLHILASLIFYCVRLLKPLDYQFIQAAG